MLMTMEPEIQQNLENLHANDMLKELKTLFAQQAEHELLQTTQDFHSCKHEEGQSVSSYVMKMKGYINNLERLGHPVSLSLAVSLILIGLHKEFDGFMQNYNMHSLGKTINEFHAMLNVHEQTLPKNNAPSLHAIRAGKGKNKLAYAPKPKIPPPPKREDPTKDLICHEASKKLKPGALSLYVDNAQRKAVEAIGFFYLCLPSGLEIVLNNCHYAPSITRGVIYVSRLYEDGFINRFVNNTIQVSRNNMVYFSAIPRDGIFEIDLSNSYANESSIYTVSNKRAKIDLDSALLWHCRLGHISKKRIEKLQHDGLLNSTDLRAFEKCVPCMSGKMARKPYTHQVERAKDLLGLIHTDGRIYESKVFGSSKRSWDYRPSYSSLHSTTQWCVREENRTLLDMVQSMMSQTTLPKSFWDYALETAARILNMVPTKKVEKTLYEVWHGQAPKLSYLKVWGCEALVKRDTLTKPDKLEPRSIECIFIGYPKETMGYSFYYLPKNKFLVARNADIVPIRRSTRTRCPTDRMCLYIDADEHELGDLSEPANYKVALLDPKSDKWLNVMNVEMQSMIDNEVWVLVEL
ncbi:zinc finger, CCHC-type containing protein, partial [Tanacetum coccineum]